MNIHEPSFLWLMTWVGVREGAGGDIDVAQDLVELVDLGTGEQNRCKMEYLKTALYLYSTEDIFQFQAVIFTPLHFLLSFFLCNCWKVLGGKCEQWRNVLIVVENSECKINYLSWSLYASIDWSSWLQLWWHGTKIIRNAWNVLYDKLWRHIFSIFIIMQKCKV